MAEDLCERAGQAFSDRAWSEAADLFGAADAQGSLEAHELECWGLAAYLAGRDAESDAARERAHYAYLEQGDVDGAARVAFWLCLALRLRGEPVRGNGWMQCLQRVLEDNAITDSVWQGYVLTHAGMGALFGGDPRGAIELLDRAIAISDRFGDPNLGVLARNGRGQSLISAGDVLDGLAQLDEVMVAVTTSDQISPQAVGLVYCAGINACRDTLDLQRGREWTQALSRWCSAQPELVPYRGQCLVHRAEILQLLGFWPDAMSEVQKVHPAPGDPLSGAATGTALYQLGELHRLRGEPAEAEAAYREASRTGQDPQPGLALLRLEQGQVAAAFAAIRRALDEVHRPVDRLRLLPAVVEIALAAHELDVAEQAAAELENAAAELGQPLREGAALHARGALQLASKQARAALPTLRQAWSVWQNAGVPYEAARVRVLIASACREVGDDDSAEIELDAARWVFEQLGAAPDLRRVAELAKKPAKAGAPGGLTLREVEVLRTVASGSTNRAIATELFLSEKTVARHVANIFTKLEVSTRAAATAFAYENNLV